MDTMQEMAEHDQILKEAEAKANEELDEVKAMNAEMMQARVRTIRDQQMLLKKRREQQEKEEDAAMARKLEENRQRAIKIYENREIMLKEQRKLGGEVLMAQIEEKRANNNLEMTRREREKLEMIRANKRALEEEQSIVAEKKKRSSEFLTECMTANSLAMKRKQQEKEREIEESNAIIAYQKEKAAREEEYERKVLAQKALKEKEIAEVRKLQQRVLDSKAIEDELRARRITEEQERKAREQELDKIHKTQQLTETMRQDREQAQLLRQRRLIEIAAIEKAEFDRITEAQRQNREKEREAHERKLKMQEDYRKDLLADTQARREVKRMQPLNNLDEQKHLDELNNDYMDRLERIRQMKLDQLRSEGIPEKYLADLQNKRFVLK
ncbi:hypothetical protein TRFO_10258 [Tritrichomonas foetus]|uniref:Cilia- and flagella-associated protein 45 n=1 Tax=Tritrichomonas foetus TaxID=1144522 RepID=A0A1J4JB11_9EUKA|nr:hypothetical protein TRFO_10258 [Tritrichomonas foetus]|eukprot:OHS95857.1 hypothetical protein TRFO_10258 [Tritrichomonas foetus]